MAKPKIRVTSILRVLSATALVLICVNSGVAAPRLGRAVVADMSGNATYGSPLGTFTLTPGMALTHDLTLRTDKASGVCAVLTPGAVMCIGELSELYFKELVHMPEAGLPSSDVEQKRFNRINVTMSHGDLLVNAGEPNTGPSVAITLGGSVIVKSHGGRFTIGQSQKEWKIHVERGELKVSSGGNETTIAEGYTMLAKLGRSDAGLEVLSNSPDTAPEYEFHTCREYFRTLQPIAFDWRSDGLGQLQSWIEGNDAISLIGNPSDWEDVSPSQRRSDESRSAQVKEPPAADAPPGARRRWEMWNWHEANGEMKGVNYIPRTAVNTTEMWQRDTFDRDTINQELEWANNSGYNSLRVFLQYAVWKEDPDGIKDRMNTFLDIAEDHELETVFVLFDDMRIAGRDPEPGPQPAPVPGVHNSQWTPSPGHDLVTERAGAWKDLERYVKDIIDTFGDDDRVVLWDLYNRPGHSGMGNKSLPLLKAAFQWAREAKPTQPLTAGVELELGAESARDIMNLSDVITFNAYDDAEDVESRLLLAEVPARPVVCTGWLRRARGNTFKEVLPIFAENDVGWYHWGLVAGRTQMYLPWSQTPATQTPMWEQDVLDAEGNPYNEEEIKLIKSFRFDDPLATGG